MDSKVRPGIVKSRDRFMRMVHLANRIESPVWQHPAERNSMDDAGYGTLELRSRVRFRHYSANFRFQ